MPSSRTPKGIEVVDLAQIQANTALKRTAQNTEEGTSKGINIAGQNIVTMSVPDSQIIESFEPSKIRDNKSIRYSDVKHGSKNFDSQKNARFKLSELSRGPLSVEIEEEHRIEQEIQARLKERFDAIKDDISKEAYNAGFEKGLEDAKKEFLTQSKPRVEQFEKLLNELENAKVELYKANEEFLIRLIYRLTKSVILRELKDETDYTRRIILHLIDRVGTKENIKIFIGEKAFSTAEEIKAGLAQYLGQLKNISIELDSTMNNRGCRIETEFGEVDARIDVQIDNLGKTLGVTSG